MSDLKLNIYESGKVVKTYRAENSIIPFGVIEDIINTIQLDKLENDKEVAKMVLACMPQIKPLLKGIFEGVTDEELRKTNALELIPLVIQTVKKAMSDMQVLIGNDEKN